MHHIKLLSYLETAGSQNKYGEGTSGFYRQKLLLSTESQSSIQKQDLVEHLKKKTQFVNLATELDKVYLDLARSLKVQSRPAKTIEDLKTLLDTSVEKEDALRVQYHRRRIDIRELYPEISRIQKKYIQSGAGKKYAKSGEKIKIPGRSHTRTVYLGKRGGKYFKIAGAYVSLSRLSRR